MKRRDVPVHPIDPQEEGDDEDIGFDEAMAKAKGRPKVKLPPVGKLPVPKGKQQVDDYAEFDPINPFGNPNLPQQ